MAGQMKDITNPKAGVEVILREDGQVLWVNVDGECVLRICQIKVPILWNMNIKDKEYEMANMSPMQG